MAITFGTRGSAIPGPAKFQDSGSSPPHTWHANHSSLTTFRCPHLGQRRKRTSVVNRPGWGTPIRSRASATAAHDSGSGQKPVERLETSSTAASPAVEKNISPAERTGPPPAQATCSERRSASRSTPSGSITNVAAAVTPPAPPPWSSTSHESRSPIDSIRLPPGVPKDLDRIGSGPT